MFHAVPREFILKAFDVMQKADWHDSSLAKRSGGWLVEQVPAMVRHLDGSGVEMSRTPIASIIFVRQVR